MALIDVLSRRIAMRPPRMDRSGSKRSNLGRACSLQLRGQRARFALWRGRIIVAGAASVGLQIKGRAAHRQLREQMTVLWVGGDATSIR